ncbi:MAG: alanine dehydrogenase, partial [Alphaproteobacteria bacterium]|nr:alanine dehydrogenase [Alphaproteobacteria bacterium]
MRIGVPKEIKPQEFRVGLTPESVKDFVLHGHEVLVESQAGAGIGAGDEAYLAAGAKIAQSIDQLFADAEMIVKVKEPQPVEIARLRPHHWLFTYLHLAPDPEQTKGLLASGCSAIAYETIRDAQGSLPLLAPMSEVAGRLAMEAAGAGLRRLSGGRGLLLGGVPGVRPARVVILGGGVVGTQAARMAVGMGAEVTIIDRSLPRLRQLDDIFQGRVRTRASTHSAIDAEIREADAVIGAVLVPGASAPRLVTRAMLKDMKPGAVLLDVAIDQGGCFETSHPTTHAEPTFIVDHIVHYCVANMPGAVPLTSSNALNNATVPYGLALAANPIAALKHDPGLLAGLNIRAGKITNRAVALSQNREFT